MPPEEWPADHRGWRYRGTLAEGFLDTVARAPGRPALEIGGGPPVSYAALAASASRLAAALDEAAPVDEPPLTAVFGCRSELAYAGVLAALLRGHGYVPLHPDYPPARVAHMITRAGCRALVVDGRGSANLDAVLASFDAWPLILLLPDEADAVSFAARWPGHRFLLSATGDAHSEPLQPRRCPAPHDVAYLLFTSGSTGHPKGVMVPHIAVRSFLAAIVARYPELNESDRFSQNFDLTFDLSVFDLFVAWQLGACVCCPAEEDRILPTVLVERARLTVWFSVPSAGLLLARLGALGPAQFRDLKLSLFCGEALPASLAEAWQTAAPLSRVENLYGPTEVTIACTAYRWDPRTSPGEVDHGGLVPIGVPLAGLACLVVDEDLREVSPGQIGELLMTGPQLALGYLGDPAQTARTFVKPPGRSAVHYRTGDRVRRPARPDAPLAYIGRIDTQVKIRGYRVELGEVEAALRAETGATVAVAIAWPPSPSGADGVVAFLEDAFDATAGRHRLEPEGARLRAQLARRLPPYMQPQEIRFVTRFPLNGNGKVDRGALERLLGDRSRSGV